MQDFRGNFKRLEFGQTPAKPTQLNEFQSSQRQKYENIQSKVQTSSYIAKENVTMVQKELYELLIPVKVKNGGDDWNTQLVLKMILQQSAQGHGQLLHIELTDETNYQFLQVMDLNETEFIALKNEQSLHVDFSTFPAKLADLLQLCMNKDEKVSFYVTLENKQGEQVLAVVENNEFKRLTHLALRFRTATDEILKNFLSQKLSKERVENEELLKQNRKLEEGLQERSWEVDSMRAELRRFSEERDSTVQQLLLEEQKKINTLKEQSLSKESTFVKEHENERKLMVDKYERMVNELQTKNHMLYDQNQELSEAKMQLQQSERELKNKNNGLVNENNQLNKEVGELRVINKELDQVRFSQERSLIELRIQKDSLDKQLNDREQYLNNKQLLVENEKKQNSILEEQIQQYKKQVEKMENRLQVCSEEVNKGNQIIEKLQSELGKQKEKIKLKNTVVLQQEQTVQQLQESNDSLNKQFNEYRRQQGNADIRLKELESINNDLKNKLQESQKLIESNNSMIQYLNKCLNESKSAPVMPAMSTFKAQTFTKYTNPLQEDRSFQNNSQQQQQNMSQLSNTITNRFNF